MISSCVCSALVSLICFTHTPNLTSVCVWFIQEGVCQVLLHEGQVVVRAGNNEIKTVKTYNDDNSHYVSIYINSKG